MPPLTLTFSPGFDTSLASHTRDESANTPFSGMAYAQGALQLPTLGHEFDATLTAKVMGGLDNQDTGQSSPQTLLGGAMDRWIVYRNRLDHPAFDLSVLKAEGVFLSPGLKFYAGISPQEDYVYPYNFNVASFTHAGQSWDAPTLRYNVFDNSSGANIYTAKIGWLGGAEWIPPFFNALRLAAQTGMDGGFGGSSSWATTGQIGFQKAYTAGSTALASGLAVYATHLTPESATNDNGETVSPTNGAGLFASQDVGPVGVGIGYAFKDQTTQGEGVKITSGIKGLNLGYRIKLMEGRTFLSGAFSYLGFHESTKAFVSSIEDTAEKSLEPVNISFAIFPGLVAGVGYALVLVDQKNQTNTAVHGNEQIFYINLNGNGSWQF